MLDALLPKKIPIIFADAPRAFNRTLIVTKARDVCMEINTRVKWTASLITYSYSNSPAWISSTIVLVWLTVFLYFLIISFIPFLSNGAFSQNQPYPDAMSGGGDSGVRLNRLSLPFVTVLTCSSRLRTPGAILLRSAQ